MVWITYKLRQENYEKKQVKMEMRREGKEVVFQDGTLLFLNLQQVFTWDSQKKVRKNEIRLSKQQNSNVTCKLQDL